MQVVDRWMCDCLSFCPSVQIFHSQILLTAVNPFFENSFRFKSMINHKPVLYGLNIQQFNKLGRKIGYNSTLFWERCFEDEIRRYWMKMRRGTLVVSICKSYCDACLWWIWAKKSHFESLRHKKTKHPNCWHIPWNNFRFQK